MGAPPDDLPTPPSWSHGTLTRADYYRLDALTPVERKALWPIAEVAIS